MANGYIPQQGVMWSESNRLADADLSERDRVAEDHSAHAAGKTCMICGRAIEAGQDARRRGEADWMHEVCPVTAD